MIPLSDFVTQQLDPLQPVSHSLGITISFKRNSTEIKGFLKIKVSFILFKRDRIL